ncbi:unnamed protein product [Trichobilharzia regenti]|nr:unnamed protein product [Trichobilharzia regenti]
MINSLKPITASLLTSLNPDDGSLSFLGQNSTSSNRVMMNMRGNDVSLLTFQHSVSFFILCVYSIIYLVTFC